MKQFSLNHHGMNLVVEFDQRTLFWYRTRLVINNEITDDRSLFSGTTRLRVTHPQPVTVDATMGFFGPRKVTLRDGAESVAFTKDQ